MKRKRALGKLEMLTDEGEEWKKVVNKQQSSRRNLNLLKTLAGGLGIAAGALVLASNPVGWALGIAVGAVGAGLTMAKIGGKLNNMWKARKKKKEILNADPSKTPEYVTDEDGEELEATDEEKRERTIELANEVAAECSVKARVAGEMIQAVRTVEEEDEEEEDEEEDYDYNEDEEDYLYDLAEDAENVLTVIKVKKEDALSPSGQEYIEKKLSGLESI